MDLVLRLTRSTKELGLDRETQKQKFRADIELLLVFISDHLVVRIEIPVRQ
jgi:hypothetical protein